MVCYGQHVATFFNQRGSNRRGRCQYHIHLLQSPVNDSVPAFARTQGCSIFITGDVLPKKNAIQDILTELRWGCFCPFTMVLVRVGPDHRHHRLLSTLSTFKLDINNICTKRGQLLSSCFNSTTYTLLKIFQEELTWQSNPSALDTIRFSRKNLRGSPIRVPLILLARRPRKSGCSLRTE